ncbi:MAG: ClpXP protease specificity-enhancing factor SspB [Pseudomonadota bacterium]
MSDDDTSLIDYPGLTQNALRGVVRDVLEMLATAGETPGEHHFFIEFSTHHPGVDIPDYLREQYPDRMSIVLQHQFYDLGVDHETFEVTLKFKGKPERLVVPFDAMTSFVDPSVDYGLRFEPVEAEPFAPEAPPAQTEDEGGDDAPKPEGGAEVVSLDQFRKK